MSTSSLSSRKSILLLRFHPCRSSSKLKIVLWVSDFCCHVVAVVMGWGLQFPAGLIPFSLSVDVEAWHPNDPSVGRWFLYLTSPTFQYFAFQRSCGSVGKFLIHGSSLTSSMNSVAHVLFSLRIHWFTSNGGMPVASVSYKNVTPGGGSRTSGESLKKKKKGPSHFQVHLMINSVV